MASEVFEFGDVTVDLRRVSVSRGGQPVSLEPKTFDVLRYLIEHRDRVVTKEELLDAVWKDTFVTPNVLTRAIAQMRKGLGDDAFEARYIQTVAKRGYRFIARVRADEPVPAPQVSEPPASSRLENARSAVTAARRFRAIEIAALLLFVLLGFGFYALRDRSETAAWSSETVALSPRRFTTGSSSYSFPAISPDGRTVAYSSNETGALEIYTAGFAAGSTPVALTRDGGQNIHAAWSPDGQWIAYHSRGKGGIWITPSSGGSARQVVDFGAQPEWGADSQRLFFTSDAGGMAAQSVLWSVHRDGGDRRQITKLGAPRGGHSRPSVSPDGRYVAFVVSHGHLLTEIWIAPVDGGPGQKLGLGATPRFAPDGKAVYWVGRTVEGNDALMRDWVGDNGTAAGHPETLQTFPGTFIGDFSIARDGTSVLWLVRAVGNIWTVEVKGNGVVAPVQLTRDDVRNTMPRHSSGGRIAYQQYAAGQPPTTWIVDEDGKNREGLTVGLSSAVFNPQWAPDERRLFVATGKLNFDWSFAWLDIATRQLTAIPIQSKGVMSANLSPDGREIAFHVIDEQGVINVWKQMLEGGARTQLTFDTEAMSYPIWSPDGKTLAIEIKRGDHTHIGLVSKDGGAVEPLVTGRGQSWPFSWAPDNDRIAFAGERDGVWNIYTVSRKTKEVRQVTDFWSVEGYVRYPSWSKTRPVIAFERADQVGSLWTVKLETKN